MPKVCSRPDISKLADASSRWFRFTADNQDRREIGVTRITGDGPLPIINPASLVGHSAAGFRGESHDAIDAGIATR